MGFDGFVMRAIVHELQPLVGGRVTKIYQPSETDVILLVRAHGENHRLFLSASHTIPRIYQVQEQLSNPPEPPLFCMVLRKHLEGGLIAGIGQMGLDRVCWLDIRSRNELGDWGIKRLVLEVMGKHSNLILIDLDSQRILEAIHHVPAALSQYRQVLPGRTYTPPPPQEKAVPWEMDRESFFAAIDWNRGKLEKQLVERYFGIGPTLAREILHRAGLPTRDNVWHAFSEIINQLKRHHYEPTVINGEKDDFHVIPLHSLDGKKKTCPTVSQCLESFYKEQAQKERIRQQAHDLKNWLENEMKKNLKKMEKLRATLEEAKQAEDFRLFGELVTANLYRIQPGDTELIAENFYEESMPQIRVPLDPALSPSENAQAYFKKYNKAKNSLRMARQQLELAEEENRYFETILAQLALASDRELEEIREELIEQGYLRSRKTVRKKRKTEPPRPQQFRSSEGFEILVGKNNRQNDYLTGKLANRNDTWLHAKDIPGSHVVIRGQHFTEQTLKEAALLAAWFSKAQRSSQVPVDYTLIRHVHKPSGAKPGFVIYEKQKTIYVTPTEEALEPLLKTQHQA
jgi:predicted ribosome quality control (RQC) complex YloA/Tae2 family protein